MAPISADSGRGRRLRRGPPPTSLPRRERRYDREMVECRMTREKMSDFSRIVPEINGGEVRRMRRTGEQMGDRVRARMAPDADVAIDFVYAVLIVLKPRTVARS